jgi:sulfoacetaldehyde dehydrogenase
MATRSVTNEEKAHAAELLSRARVAMKEIEDYDQVRVDRLCRAIGWATANEKTFSRIARMGVDESGLGDPEGRVAKRFKIMGILRDISRQKSVGVIASIIPTANPELTPPGVGLFAIKCRDAVIFAPQPRSKNTTFEMVRVMRDFLKREGAPPDLFQFIAMPSIPSRNS